jgi:uncharacterized protein
MAIKIEETFQVRAPVDRVWRWLVDPRQVVTCLPGAELTGQEGETTWLGRVKVKVGPVTASYAGRATIVEQDDAAHVVRLRGEGREPTGSGSATMSMTSRMTALPDGGTEVRVEADVDVVGKVAQFGRGMMESVSKQLFRQFTECVRAQLERAEPAAEPTSEPMSEPTAEPTAAATAPADEVTTAAVLPPLRVVASAAPPAARPAKPVKLLPLVLRALWDMIARL